MITDDDRREHDEWLAQLPPLVAEQARRLLSEPIDRLPCFRLKDQPDGHYTFTPGHGIGEPLDEATGKPIPGAMPTLTLTHLSDSFLPGVPVFGIRCDEAEPCGCVDARVASPEEARASSDFVEAIASVMRELDPGDRARFRENMERVSKEAAE